MASISTLSNTDSFADTLARCAPGHSGTVESRRDSIDGETFVPAMPDQRRSTQGGRTD
jgi:hypothetical protein